MPAQYSLELAFVLVYISLKSVVAHKVNLNINTRVRCHGKKTTWFKEAL